MFEWFAATLRTYPEIAIFLSLGIGYYAGRFTFRGITPGDYRIFAWEDIEPFAYFDPAVVKQYEALGKAIRVQEASSESAEVRLIPAATQ
mgnify:CR=1 FL=1